MAGNIRTSEVKAIVNIDGEQVNFVRLRIAQEMGKHHDFEVLIDYSTFTETFHETPEKFMKKTNTKVVIDLFHADQPESVYVFSGLVTNLTMHSSEGAHGGILFVGKSNSIELERGKIRQSYSNTNLQEIFQTVTSGTMNLETVIQPSWDRDIDFALQYDESDWEFLVRTCRQYRERVWYSGLDLVLGRHREFNTISLTYNMELRSLDICSRLVPNQFSTYYYERENHATLRQDSPDTIENATNLLNIINRRSENLTWSRRSNTPTEAYIPDMDSLIDHTKRRKVSDGGRMMYIRCESKVFAARIGRLVDIKMPDNLGGTDIGLYRVYKIVHELDQNGHYFCEFEALPADLEHIPQSEVHVPIPNLIEAEVVDNEDPAGIGRIRVQLPFDDRPCETWIPVMTPDAGGNGHGLGPVSRGYSFLPEKNDTVALSFLDGPWLSHPVVVGSMFHGANAVNLGGTLSGVIKGNHLKTITDKSKGQIIMNTNENGTWGITIRDRKGNLMEIDTQNENILITANHNVTVSAGETMTLNCKNMFVNVEETMQTRIGEDMITSVGNNQQTGVRETIEVTSKNKTETYVEDVNTLIGLKQHIESGETELLTMKGNIVFKSAGKALLQGAKDARISRG